MEAIISAGRTGKIGIVGGTLYVTTFPCHCCARHIVAAGIKTVYYIEPYPKSLALELHDDSIGTEEDKNKVAFLQYEGCAPRIMKLFHKETKRKEKDGRARVAEKKTAMPIRSTPMDSFIIHERNAVKAHEIYEEENRNKYKPVATLLERLMMRPAS
jgi:deoxycytidylate deaminase